MALARAQAKPGDARSWRAPGGFRVFLASLCVVAALAIDFPWEPPADMATVDGLVATASIDDVHRGYVTNYVLHLSLQGRGEDFRCPAEWLHGRSHDALALMKPGARARVHFVASAPARAELWGLAVEDRVLLDPSDMVERRRENASSWLLLATVFALSAVFARNRPATEERG